MSEGKYYFTSFENRIRAGRCGYQKDPRTSTPERGHQPIRTADRIIVPVNLAVIDDPATARVCKVSGQNHFAEVTSGGRCFR